MSTLVELLTNTNFQEYSDRTLTFIAISAAPETAEPFGNTATLADITDIAKIVKSMIASKDVEQVKTFFNDPTNRTQLNIRIYSLISARQYQYMSTMAASMSQMAKLLAEKPPYLSSSETTIEAINAKNHARQANFAMLSNTLLLLVFAGLLYLLKDTNNVITGCLVAAVTHLITNLATVFGYLWGGSNDTPKPKVTSTATSIATGPEATGATAKS